jgi:hypothetical protein
MPALPSRRKQHNAHRNMRSGCSRRLAAAPSAMNGHALARIGLA